MTKNQTKEFIPSTAIYTPAEAAAYAKLSVEEAQAQKHRAVRFPVPGIDDYFAPILPGQIAAIIAQTSNYKSGFMHFWQRHLAEQLMAEERTDECVVSISVEECVEEQVMVQIGAETGEDAGALARGEVQDWNRLVQASIKIGQIPIYRVGDSLARADDFPNLYLSNIIRSLKFMQDELLGHKLKFAAIFLDYLQALPIDPEIRVSVKDKQRRLQVKEDVYRSRYMGAYFKCPVIVGVQAKQKLDGAAGVNMQLPGVYDGEETSSIGQRFDRVWTQWMPKMTHSVGDWLEHKDIGFRVEENLLFGKVCKQRGRLPSGRSFKMRINYQKNDIRLEEPDII
jgi:hypothetical protein